MKHCGVISYSIKKALHLYNIWKRRKTLASYAVPLLFYEKSYPYRIRNVYASLYPFPVTGEPVCSYSPFERFQSDAPRWVLYFPSAVSQHRQLSVLQSIYTIPFLCIYLYLCISLIRFQFSTSTWFCQGVSILFQLKHHKKIIQEILWKFSENRLKNSWNFFYILL